MSGTDPLARFKEQFGPVVLALPRSRRRLKSHLFLSDGLHRPGLHRLWSEPLCGAPAHLPHCDPQEESWPTCESCRLFVKRLIQETESAATGVCP